MTEPSNFSYGRAPLLPACNSGSPAAEGGGGGGSAVGTSGSTSGGSAGMALASGVSTGAAARRARAPAKLRAAQAVRTLAQRAWRPPAPVAPQPRGQFSAVPCRKRRTGLA